MTDMLLVFNTASHVALIVLVGYLVFRQRHEGTRVDTLEREVGYVKGRINGTKERR